MTSALIVQSVESWAKSSPKATAIRRKHRGIWLETTWAELASDVTSTSRALAKLGVGSGSRVGIFAENSQDWIVADLGIRGASASLVALPTRASAEQLTQWLTGLSTVFCGDQEHVDKIMTADSGVTTIVAFDTTGLGEYAGVTVLPVAEFREAGSVDAGALPPVDPESVASLDVTDSDVLESASGADSEASGRRAIEFLDLTEKDRAIAVAPFTSADTRATDVYATLMAGAVLHLPETLTSVPDDLQDVMPTVLSGPRRLFELLHYESCVRQRETGRIRRRLIAWGFDGPPTSGLRRFVVTRPIATQHGLAHVRRAVVTGDERLSASTHEFFEALRVPIVDDHASAAAPGSRAALEAELRENPCIRRAIIDGDEKTGPLSAFVELDFQTTAIWATDNGVDFGTQASLASNEAVYDLVATEVRRVNGTVGGAAQIESFAISLRAFTVSEGDLAPSLIVRRDVVRSALADSLVDLA